MKTPIQMSDAELLPYVSEWQRRKIERQGNPRAKIMRPCKKCGTLYGAREMRKHIPTCKIK